MAEGAAMDEAVNTIRNSEQIETTVDAVLGHTDHVRAGSLVAASPDPIISGSYNHSAMLRDKRIGATDTSPVSPSTTPK